jgi:ATP-dependent DNA ligase
MSAGGEGVILKRKNSLYVMGKKPAWMWVKYKLKDETDLIITGYEPPKVEYKGNDFDKHPYWMNIDGIDRPVTKYHYMGWIGALELSAYVNGKLTKICTCSGFDETVRKDFTDNKDIYLGKVVKVTYMQKTEVGYPRSPRFSSFHEGKRPEECIWEFTE